MKTTLPDEMLTKCDRMTMINGVEGRVPFLDHRMVEMAFSIPSGFKQDEKNGKLPLRNLLAKRMGHDLAFRNKTGFNSPLQQWLKNDNKTYEHALQVISNAAELGFINDTMLRELLANMRHEKSTNVFDMVCLATFFNNNPFSTRKNS
jgi:asparagine synthase (glutamine-hydrolysing)